MELVKILEKIIKIVLLLSVQRIRTASRQSATTIIVAHTERIASTAGQAPCSATSSSTSTTTVSSNADYIARHFIVSGRTSWLDATRLQRQEVVDVQRRWTRCVWRSGAEQVAAIGLGAWEATSTGH